MCGADSKSESSVSSRSAAMLRRSARRLLSFSQQTGYERPQRALRQSRTDPTTTQMRPVSQNGRTTPPPESPDPLTIAKKRRKEWKDVSVVHSVNTRLNAKLKMATSAASKNRRSTLKSFVVDKNCNSTVSGGRRLKEAAAKNNDVQEEEEEQRTTAKRPVRSTRKTSLISDSLSAEAGLLEALSPQQRLQVKEQRCPFCAKHYVYKSNFNKHLLEGCDPVDDPIDVPPTPPPPPAKKAKKRISDKKTPKVEVDVKRTKNGIAAPAVLAKKRSLSRDLKNDSPSFKSSPRQLAAVKKGLTTHETLRD